uniref:CSON009143 protein n=1 Tax=Culicoides sonorensis TaxID=179676 RepID=A0A336LNG0_CULSO
MEQFEQLLTCCVCLDRYRNPKLLPCQHSFCMEPCMDGLVDYVRRQVKCPECRAEHRIPYQGVQGFPTNVTLQRFLELHIEITGELPDPTSGQTMERCNVCSEKNYCTLCVHCEKKICPDCKSAHMDILRREIVRINNQIRRGIHRLQDTLALVEKNMQNLSTNCNSVTEEIDEMNKRLFKALRDRTDYLKGEVDRYVTTEMKNLRTLKENLELEIANIQSNCDLADKHMTDSVEWDDCELVDTKEIFLKTVEFMRNFEYETSDYNRRVRFTMALDPNQLVMNVANYGDLNIIHPAPSGTSGLLQAPVGPGLLRSKSDHRLATQFRQQEAQGLVNDDEPLLGGRKFGERPVKSQTHADARGYGRGNDYGGDYDYDNDSTSSRPKSRFRSRFVRGHGGDGDSDNESGRNVEVTQSQKDKNKITSTEDTSKGPLSGIFRLMDSPRVMKRLQDQERGSLQKKVTPPPAPATTAQAVVPKQTANQPPVTQKKTTSRQMSEDEIDRIKRQNKGASSSTAPSSTVAATVPEPERPTSDRVSALKRQPSTSTPTNDNNSNSDTTTQNTANEQALFNNINEADESSDNSYSNLQLTSSHQQSTTAGSKTTSGSATASKQPARAPSNESSASSDSTPAVTNGTATQEKKPFQSRFLHSTPPLTTEPPKEETETSSEEETSEEETESEEESEEETKPTPAATSTSTSRPSTTTPAKSQTVEPPKPETSSYRTRSSQMQDEARSDSRKNSREEPRSTYGQSASSAYKSSPTHSSFERDESPKYGRVRPSATSATVPEPEPESRYGSSRFLNKSKSSAIVPPDDEKDEDSDSKYGTGRQRYMALKERRTRLARSRSSHNFGNDDDDDDPPSPTTVSPAAYIASRYGPSSALGSSGASELSRSRSTHILKSRENSPDRGATGSSTSGGKDGAELSSWARYLKNKYGTRSRESKDTPSSSSTTSDRHGTSSSVTPSSTARRLSLGLPLRQANDFSSDDDSKNAQGSPTSPTVVAGIVGLAGLSPRAHYLQKRRQLFQIGGRGAEPGSFTWPRGIAVGGDNAIVVADSSNHRVQVFDENGIFQKEFGQYGNGDGEFDCLAGIAVNRIGQYIIADRYNHRIQVLDPSGRFVRAFGSQGTSDGKFNYPWGISTDQLGFIYVCDKENHRIQVFQSDGTFVGKFGTCGNKEGQLEHPHYIAVSNNNRVIVSDSNNHRIQVFDINGRVLSAFGTEGSEEGQFKFPRGVAVDEHGYIVVADSGNNRIQIFHPDGSFLRAFGSWGSGDAEFKGLEGVAIMTNGSILVCDRENHRVQVF